MKTKECISTGFFFILVILFTSCSTSVDIAKRQFNNGYYVHINGPKHKAGAAVTVKEDVPVQTAENKADVVPVNTVQAGMPASAKEEVISDNNSFSASIETKHPVSIRKKIRDVVVLKEVTSIENGTHESPKHTYSSKRMDRIAGRFVLGGGVPDIVLVLLCLFLPFIAVGIVDDWGNRFWIDLLLCLLFYIPGVIYAFIVCFS